jgi:hypothetical protein
MKRLSWSALFFALVMIASSLSAAPLPLTFHWSDNAATPALRVESYEMKEGPNQELRIHLSPEDAKILQQMTAKNLGRTLILKQGERVLASPTIRAAIQGQDFVVTLKK